MVAGTYHLAIRVARGPGAGILRLASPKTKDGPAGGAVDLYATDGAAGTWEGKTHFCVAPETRFRAAGRGNCAERGFDRRGFFEVDTGKKPDWTQTLSN